MAADRLVTLSRVDPPGDSQRYKLFGAVDESLAGHDGGFEEIERDGRVSGVRYKGVSAYRFVLPLVTSRVELRRGINGSVEEKIEWLRLLAEHRSWLVRPPTLTVSGPLPYEVLRRRWLVNGVRPLEQDLIRDSGTGLIAQQRIELDMVEDVRLLARTPVQAAQAAAVAPSRTGTVAAGEDGLRFAARTMGDASAWLRIAALNGIGPDPLAVSSGQQLRLP